MDQTVNPARSSLIAFLLTTTVATVALFTTSLKTVRRTQRFKTASSLIIALILMAIRIQTTVKMAFAAQRLKAVCLNKTRLLMGRHLNLANHGEAKPLIVNCEFVKNILYPGQQLPTTTKEMTAATNQSYKIAALQIMFQR